MQHGWRVAWCATGHLRMWLRSKEGIRADSVKLPWRATYVKVPWRATYVKVPWRATYMKVPWRAT